MAKNDVVIFFDILWPDGDHFEFSGQECYMSNSQQLKNDVIKK